MAAGLSSQIQICLPGGQTLACALPWRGPQRLWMELGCAGSEQAVPRSSFSKMQLGCVGWGSREAAGAAFDSDLSKSSSPSLLACRSRQRELWGRPFHFPPSQAEARGGAVVSAIAEPPRDRGQPLGTGGRWQAPPCHHTAQRAGALRRTGSSSQVIFLPPNLNPVPALPHGEPRALGGFSQENWTRCVPANTVSHPDVPRVPR